MTNPVNVVLPLTLTLPLKVAVLKDWNGAYTETGEAPLKNTLLPTLVNPLLKRTGALLVTLPNIWMGAQNVNVIGPVTVVFPFKVVFPLKVLPVAVMALVLAKVIELASVTRPLTVLGELTVTGFVLLKYTKPPDVMKPLLNVMLLKVSVGAYIETKEGPLK